MITQLQIGNFRGIRNLQLNGLKRVNLFAGANNAGKTALLESLYLVLEPEKALSEPAEDQPIWKITQPGLRTAFRNAANISEPFENFWRWMFSEADVSQAVRVQASWTKNQELLVTEVFEEAHTQTRNSGSGPGRMSYDNCPARIVPTAMQAFRRIGANTRIFSTIPSDPVREAVDYNRVVSKLGEERVVNLLQKVDPRLQTLRSLQTGTRPLIYAHIGKKEMIPVSLLGQGFGRLLDIYSELIAAESKVLLIDEVENGIHHSVMKDVWYGLAAAAHTENVQIFATTHSWECIRAAHECFSSGEEYDFALHRLDRSSDGNLKVVTYDRDSLGAAVEHELEVR